MKLLDNFKDFENKWVALKQKPREVIAWARSYKALERKLNKDQKKQVVLIKVPKFDQTFR